MINRLDLILRRVVRNAGAQSCNTDQSLLDISQAELRNVKDERRVDEPRAGTWGSDQGVPQVFQTWCGAVVLAIVLGLAGCSSTGNRSVRSGPGSGKHRPADMFAAGASEGSLGNDGAIASPVTMLFVNGDTVTADDVLNPVREELTERTRTMAPKRYRSYLVDLVKARIRAAARDLLLFQEASKGITEQEWEKLDEFVDARVRDIVNSEHAGRQTRYEKALAGKGMTLQDDRDRIRRELVIQRYLYQNVGQRVAEPTRRELWQYFEQQKDSLREPSRREMFLVEVTRTKPIEVVTADGSTRPADASETIAKAKAELDAGADFATVAKTYSTGIHAGKGGAWGRVAQNSVRQRWQSAVDALFALESGQHSDVIETDEAFFIVKCGQIDPGQEPDFQSVQAELIKRYRDHQFNVLVDELVLKLQFRSVIEPQDLSRFLRGVLATAPEPTEP